MADGGTRIEIGLNAAIVAVQDPTPLILAVSARADEGSDEPEGLPSGPFDPHAHRTFEIGLREWVEEHYPETMRFPGAPVITEPDQDPRQASSCGAVPNSPGRRMLITIP